MISDRPVDLPMKKRERALTISRAQRVGAAPNGAWRAASKTSELVRPRLRDFGAWLRLSRGSGPDSA
jgi:hypothetical protein